MISDAEQCLDLLMIKYIWVLTICDDSLIYVNAESLDEALSAKDEFALESRDYRLFRANQAQVSRVVEDLDFAAAQEKKPSQSKRAESSK